MSLNLPLGVCRSPLPVYVTTPNAPNFEISMFWALLVQSPKLFRYTCLCSLSKPFSPNEALKNI